MTPNPVLLDEKMIEAVKDALRDWKDDAVDSHSMSETMCRLRTAFSAVLDPPKVETETCLDDSETARLLTTWGEHPNNTELFTLLHSTLVQIQGIAARLARLEGKA
jgi:hypothetical protein